MSFRTPAPLGDRQRGDRQRQREHRQYQFVHNERRLSCGWWDAIGRPCGRQRRTQCDGWLCCGIRRHCRCRQQGEIDVNAGGVLSTGSGSTIYVGGVDSGENGILNVYSGGTVTAPFAMYVGSSLAGTATVNQYGGSVSIAHPVIGISNITDCVGTYNLGGGTLTSARLSPRLLGPLPATLAFSTKPAAASLWAPTCGWVATASEWNLYDKKPLRRRSAT